jgi:hypothetical protein
MTQSQASGRASPGCGIDLAVGFASNPLNIGSQAAERLDVTFGHLTDGQ